MGDLILTREDQNMFKFCDYKIFIDNNEMNEISNGTTKVISLKPGSHDVFVKVMGMKSKVKQVNINKKGTIRLTCGSRLTGIKYILAIIFIFSKNKIFLEDTI